MQRQIAAVRFIRAMRGGAQARLVEADDGHYYVVKFADNPQHRRVLINEWIGAAIMRRLGFCAPETVAIQISNDLLAKSPEVRFQLAHHSVPVAPGLALGSRYPGNPDRIAVYDFVPDSLLRSATDYGQFFGALAFDKWVGNEDKRQAVFYRSQSVRGDGGHPMMAAFIDHGFDFGGVDWNFKAIGPLAGLYHDRRIYADVTSWDVFEPWMSLIEELPEQEIWRAASDIPTEWIADDGDRLRWVVEALLRRRTRLHDLVYDVWRAQPSLFPNWERPGCW